MRDFFVKNVDKLLCVGYIKEVKTKHIKIMQVSKLYSDAKNELAKAKSATDKYYLLDCLSLLKSFLNDYPDFELYEKVINISEEISLKLAKKNSRINPEIRKMLNKINL